MLTFELDLPRDVKDGAPVLVLLHGRGSDERDLLGLRPGLPPDSILITPRAPFAAAPWGYGPGWAWYRILPKWVPDPEPLETSIRVVGELVAALPNLLPVRPGPIVVGGFSQGSTTALAYALLNPGAVNGVMVFSGFLANHPAVLAAVPNAQGLPVFWGHGTADQMIPFELGRAGRAVLAEAGAIVTSRDVPIGHGIDGSELAAAAAWLRDSGLTTQSERVS